MTTITGGLPEALTVIGLSALSRALDPEIIRLSVMLMSESDRYPDVIPQEYSLRWSPLIQAVMDVLRRHTDTGEVDVDDIELAAEQYVAMVTALPSRLAAFGMRRPPDAEERHVQHAVELFLRGALRREPAAPRTPPPPHPDIAHVRDAG